MSAPENPAAFPSPGVVLSDLQFDKQQGAYEGMSLRDYFAGQELVRMEHAQCMVNDVLGAYDRVAVHCYKMADAMLRARQR